jgi:hypothetical protein
MPMTTTEPAPNDVPTEYLKPVIDWEKVRESLEGGAELLWAWLEPRGTHLRIR